MRARLVVGILGACLLAACEMPDPGDAQPTLSQDQSGDPTAYSDASRVTSTSKTDFEMRPRPSDEKDFPDYIQYLVDVAEPRTAEERAADAGIKRKYRKALVMDALFVGGPGFPAGFADSDVENALANLRTYHELGLRQMNFTYNIDTIYADGGGVSNDDGTDQGVKELGEEVIREMNRLGIVVDCSHSSNKNCTEAAAITRKPMMMSHSNLMTYQPIGRNVSDQAVKAVAATGAVICVNFIGGFLNPNGLA